MTDNNRISELETALRDLLEVSFPAIGADPSTETYLRQKYDEATNRAKMLLGIGQNPSAGDETASGDGEHSTNTLDIQTQAEAPPDVEQRFDREALAWLRGNDLDSVADHIESLYREIDSMRKRGASPQSAALSRHRNDGSPRT